MQALPRVSSACAALALCLAALPAAAAPPRVHALTGARIVVAPGRVIEAGTIVLRDGVIVAVGPEVSPPPDATVWEREGRTIYPGLIESYAVAPAPAPAPAPDGGATATAAAATLVRPRADVTREPLPAELAGRLRAAGFTTAALAPAAGLFRGRGALVNLGEGELSTNLLRRGGAQYVTLGATAATGYPRSKMGAVALFRQTMLDAAWQRRALAAWRRNPGQTRPAADPALEALGPAAHDEEPMVIETGNVLGSLRAIGLGEELGLELWLVGNGEEYRWLEPLAEAGHPHLVPVAFPDDPAVGDDDDLTVGLAELRHWDEAPDNPRRMLAAGLKVALTSHGLAEPKKLHANLARSIDRGLTAEQALAALTTTPAELLGIARLAGTLEPGKMANLVVAEGELFTAETRIEEVWIDGERLELEETEPPAIEPAGTWELTVETGDGQQIPVRLELVGEASSLGGSLVAQGQSLALGSATVSGDELRVEFDGTGLGMPGTIRFTLAVEGESARGSGSSPRGPFTLSGRRTARPEGGR